MSEQTPLTLDEFRKKSPTEYVLRGGTFRCGNRFELEEAVAVSHGKIVAVGREADIFTGGPVVDVAGSTVLPGFHDAHFHMMSTGMNASALNLSNCASVSEVIEVLREGCEDKKGDWVIGAYLDESNLREGRAPSLSELDSVGSSPIFINDRGLHYTLLNSAGARILDLKEKTQSNDGRLQESMSGTAKRLLADALSESELEAALHTAATIAAQKGITTIHALEGGELFADRDVDVFRSVQGRLATKTLLYWGTDDIAAIAATGATRGGGDVCVDGSIGSRTAALSKPYSDGEGRGQLLRSVDEMTDIFRRAEDYGVQFGFHAIGDRGVSSVVEAAERAFPSGTLLRHRIEHFGIPAEGVINRAAAIGLCISAQPAFMYLRGQAGGVYESRLGHRIEQTYPLLSLLKAGLHVGGGSDSDVTPADPLLGIHASINHPNAAEALDVHQAIGLFTTEAAFIGGGPPDTATISVGQPADFAILADDPFEVSAHAVKDIVIRDTVVDGQSVIVHGRPSSEDPRSRRI